MFKLIIKIKENQYRFNKLTSANCHFIYYKNSFNNIRKHTKPIHHDFYLIYYIIKTYT